MANPVFTAKTTPMLSPDAQRLVDIYDQTPGSSGPYCNPAGLAAVFDELYSEVRLDRSELLCLAASLRGEQP